MAQVPTVNAKNIQFDQPGAGVTGYGINAQNLYPKLTKLYGARTDKAGGSKAIWDAMVNNTNKSLARSKSPIALEFQNFLNTGKMPTNPTPQFQRFAAESLDYGLRETGRAQQHKNTFWDSAFGKILGPALTVGAGFIPGGQVLAPAVGATFGGLKGGLPGAVLGGLSGYGAGQFANTIGNAATATGGWGSAFSHPGAFFHNIGTELGALTSLGSSGGNMGAFGDFLGNFNYGGGNLLGDLVKGGLSYWGQQSASNQLNDAANRAFSNSQFQPYNINTPGGSASFMGNNATASLSPAAQALLKDYNGVMGQDLTAFNKFNPNNYSQNMYKTLSNLRAPGVTQANNDLLSNVYNRGQWGGTVGAGDIYSADMANNLQDQALRLQSQQAGAQESDRLFNQYMKSAAAYHSLLNDPNKLIDVGVNAGGARSQSNNYANQYPWLAAGADYGSSNAFWNSLATSAGNYLNNVNNNVGASNGIRNTYQSSMGPGGYFIDYPV